MREKFELLRIFGESGCMGGGRIFGTKQTLGNREDEAIWWATTISRSRIQEILSNWLCTGIQNLDSKWRKQVAAVRAAKSEHLLRSNMNEDEWKFASKVSAWNSSVNFQFGRALWLAVPWLAAPWLAALFDQNAAKVDFQIRRHPSARFQTSIERAKGPLVKASFGHLNFLWFFDYWKELLRVPLSSHLPGFRP